MGKKRFAVKKEETEYLQGLRDMVKEHPNLLLKEYLDYLPANAPKISEGTLSKDFKKANIFRKKELVSYSDKEETKAEECWIYKHIVPDELDEFPVEFHNYMTAKPRIMKNLVCLKIPVNIGSEEVVCKKIIKTFKSGGIICIPAYGCVCILSQKSKHNKEGEENESKSKLEQIKEILDKIYEAN